LPPKEDVLKVISVADPDTQDYLWTLVLTAARIGEVNSLKWEDVNLEDRYITLWTRKRKGGNREPRDVPMVAKLHQILSYRVAGRVAGRTLVYKLAGHLDCDIRHLSQADQE